MVLTRLIAHRLIGLICLIEFEVFLANCAILTVITVKEQLANRILDLRAALPAKLLIVAFLELLLSL